jgi:hypothetical protein
MRRRVFPLKPSLPCDATNARTPCLKTRRSTLAAIHKGCEFKNIFRSQTLMVQAVSRFAEIAVSPIGTISALAREGDL